MVHREEDVTRLRYARRTCGTGRALDALRVEQHQQRVSLASGEGQMGDVGESMGRPGLVVTVDHHIGHDPAYASDELITQRLHVCGVTGPAFDSGLDRRGESGDAGDIERAGA